MSWEAWFAHLKPVAGFDQGAIVSNTGAVCHEEGLSAASLDLKGLFNGSVTSIVLGDTKFMRLHGDDEMVMLRGNGRPAAVAATNTLYLVVVGAPDAPSGNLSLGLAKAVETFKASNL